ncbi:MAG: 4-(cytidine 5'-diphospho)-2-C-methyl-D-erythritol kinase [Bacteroidota bacterium]|nr:4-(cytidine 5'-diphospho)-2-C-methyl-D-erythritol kinase [Bacteroidota bacterium]
MISFPNCKINLGLNVIQKRNDGYHDLESVFFPVRLYDALEIVAAENETQLSTSGIDVGNPEDNLCLKAFHLLKKDYPQIPEINIHLHKTIPTGAGLGGGSADAAFMLLLLNKKFNLEIPGGKLYVYALQLGSDCPFFLLNKPCFGTSRGEILEPISLSLSGYKIILIYPALHINTSAAFAVIKPRIPAKNVRQIVAQPIETWKNELHNDFENFVFENYPQVKEIKDELYGAGAVYASMSGSGSTVFGIFNKNSVIDYPSKSGYFTKTIDLE